MDNLKMDRNRVIIRQLPEHWLDGITHDEDEDYKKVWLSLCRPETACHSNKAVMLKVFAHTATNCICCQESAVNSDGILVLRLSLPITLSGTDVGSQLLIHKYRSIIPVKYEPSLFYIVYLNRLDNI